MNLNKLEKLRHLDFLIRLEATGSPVELAEKMQVSERTVFYNVKLLKELGAKIKFDRSRNSYVYISDKRLVIGYFEKNLPPQYLINPQYINKLNLFIESYSVPFSIIMSQFKASSYKLNVV